MQDISNHKGEILCYPIVHPQLKGVPKGEIICHNIVHPQLKDVPKGEVICHPTVHPQLKGVPKEEIIPRSEQMLSDMELLPKLYAKSKTLSGGMKRKLSVCIALLGDSKVTQMYSHTLPLDM